MGLSRRFSNPRSQRRFPVNTLLLAAVGLVLGLFIAWHFNIKDIIFTPEEEDVYLSNWALPTAGAIVWASMMLLGGATLLQEDEVEEDIREAEALGWLINQAENSQTLHDALMCLPGIANTPLRRYTLLTNTRDILALLINTLVDDLDQRCLLERFGENRSIESGHDYDVDREARLMFYLACLAEVSPVTLVGETRRNPWRTRWNNLMNKVDGSWLYQNWYRVLTIPPREIMTRELRFPRTWYPWLQFTKPDVFLLDLKTLSNHPNPYISSVARAVLSHLYPSVSPLNDYSSWPVRRDKLPDNPDFFTHHKILIELRMVTLWVTDECRSSKNLETSLRRYLYRYCDNVLKLWTSGLAPQEGLEDNERDGKVFEVAIVLCYLVTENSQSILRMTDGGESTPMKAARCLTSLIRWLERGQAQDQKISAMDVEFRNSFALSIVSATAAYLQFAADTLTPGTQLTRMTRVEDDENTIFVGMKHLEIPLLKLSTREFPIPSLQGQAISALEAFYRIPGHADFKLFSWDLSDDLIPLMTELKSRAMASDAVKKRVHAIQAASKVLNLVKEPLRAWSIAIDGSPSLLEVIGSMAQDESVDIRIAALSVLLETPVLHPRKFAQREIDAATTEKASPISSDAGQIHIDVHLTPDEKLSTLYNSVLRDHSALLQAAQGSFSLYNKELIRKSLHFINMLESTVPHGSLPSTLLENGKYAGVLALIASHSDEELVDVPTRKLAISLYIRLWNSTCGANQPKPATQFEDVFGGELHLGEITKAVQWLTDHYVSVELDCIALYIMQLQHLSSPVADGLLKALKGAVACGDFGNPDVEERRQALYDQLSQFLLTTPP
ncbi:hypothetical protein FRC02_002404 [Tulasnella sp. 418]|nr:hypothetical protein FRC02_002404 [Tulasnella sp. 418]